MAAPSPAGQWLQGSGGIRVWTLVRRHPEPLGGVLLCHGYGEHSGRYPHVMEALVDRGFTVFAPDHRGHGRTARVPGDLESVDRVLGDLGRVGDALEHAVAGRPLFLVGHSLGGLLCLHLAHRESRWAGAVLNGTAIKVPDQVSPASVLAARALSKTLPWLPLQRFYDPTRGSRDPAIAAASLADPFQYKGRLRARTGAEVLAAMIRGKALAPELRLPVLLTHGGADRTIPVSASAQLHAELGSNDKELHVFPGLLHEVHQEPERDAVLARWGIWLARRARALR